MEKVNMYLNKKLNERLNLNEKYRQLGNEMREIWGQGYVEAIRDVLWYVNGEERDD